MTGRSIGYPSPQPRKDACYVKETNTTILLSEFGSCCVNQVTQPRIPIEEFGKFGVFYNILSFEYMSDQLGCRSGSALGTSG